MAAPSLNNPEAQRLMNTLNETVMTVRLLALSTPALVERAEALADLLPQRVVDELVAHVACVEAYSGALALVGGDMGAAAVQEAAQAARDSALGLERVVRENPELVDTLMSQATEEQLRSPMGDVSGVMEGLSQITYQKLVTTAEEKHARANYLMQIDKKEQAATKEIKDLQTKLSAEKKARAKAVGACQAMIQRLESEIDTIATTSASKTEQRHAHEKSTSERYVSDGEKNSAKLSAELAAAEKQLEGVRAKFQSEEEDQRRKKIYQYQKVKDVLDDYDAVMTEQRSNLDKLSAMHEGDLERITDLENKLATIDVEKEQLRLEADSRAAERTEIERQERRLHDACTKIQAIYRGHHQRSGGKKGKKGKGKDKKKGKKK